MDYKEAQEELNGFFKTLNLTGTISHPKAKNIDGWNHISFDVTFKNEKGYELTIPYKMGLGLFKIPKSLSGLTYPEENMFYAILKNGVARKYIDQNLFLQTMEKIVRRTEQGPNPANVLAGHCRDCMEARENSFEDWCGNYGLDNDSIKAKKTYDDCSEMFFQLERLIERENMERLAELSNEL